MPDIIVGTGTALLRLATTQFDRGLSDAKRRMERFASQSVTAKLGLAGPIATLAAGGAAVGGLAFAAKQAMNMEDRMVRLSRVTGLEGEKLKGLGDQFRDMATTMPGTNLEKIFGIATMGAKLGIAGPQLALFTSDVAKMSVVLEDIPIGEATEKMARLLNLFHRGPSDALGLASALNALDMASTASARDILDMTTNMSGMASTLKGISLPQMMALAAAMRQGGIEPGTGGTAMSQVLQAMVGRREAQFAKTAGMERGEFRNLVDTAPFEALKKFFGSLGQMDPRAQTKALEELHFTGQRTGGTIKQLVQTFGQLAKFEGEATRQFASGASITEGYGKTAGRTRAQLDLLWNSVETVGAKLGEGLLPIIKGASKGLTDLATDVGAFLKANEGSITSWGDRVGEALGYVGLVWRKFPLFVDYALGYATEKWEQFVHVAGKFGEQFGDNFEVGTSNLFKFFENLFTSIGGLLDAFFKDLGPNITAHLHNAARQMAIEIQKSPLLNIMQVIGGPAVGINIGEAARSKKMPVPGFKMPAGLFGAGALGAGMVAPPGFNMGEMVAGMPDRAEELAILEGDIRDARKQMDREIAARRKMADGMEDMARRQARVHDLMGRVLGEREGPQARVVGARERFRQERANMNRMLGGPAAAAAAGRRRARNLAIQARKAKGKAAVPADVAAAQAIGEAVGAALKDNEVGQEMLKLVRKIAANGDLGAIFGGP